MARTMNMEALDRKIEKAQHEVSVAKKRYDSATAELKKLLDKRDAINQEQRAFKTGSGKLNDVRRSNKTDSKC